MLIILGVNLFVLDELVSIGGLILVVDVPLVLLPYLLRH